MREYFAGAAYWKVYFLLQPGVTERSKSRAPTGDAVRVPKPILLFVVGFYYNSVMKYASFNVKMKEERSEIMKRIKVLRNVLVRTHADRLIAAFVVVFLIVALLILLVEPEVHTYGQALWFCYSVFSTCGFGDVVTITPLGRILSVVLTLLTTLVVGLVTGVIVAFYTDIVSMQYKASKAEIVDKLGHLEDLSKEELAELSERIRKISSD